ncbi:VOC family protein [Cellulophaga baltica]|uniref:VOC family protein n=1 Tax=Cellulophaga TaxID=104264 RepID=UPI001C06B22E|nr:MULTISPECIES: VOC family protein [Cellulophaga]MBU2997930.1 VOC family protein [Cellulophaga baltica]MDO6769331.1 VOC family protein [Cellulophaga sp. 1_MG-2023]
MQIKELKIYSSKINEQADFYAKVLGLTIIKSSAKNVLIAFGKSILNIEYKPETTSYHFAINIPSNKENEALEWLKPKVKVLMDENNEIQNFDSWNAKAVYFYDKDKNIVELIARKNLNNASEYKFNSKQFLEISEIGVPTLDIEKVFNQLTNLTGIEIYDGSFDRFCAIGDENGLFICINKTFKDWFPTNDKAYSSAFEIILVEKGIKYQIAYKNEEIKLL